MLKTSTYSRRRRNGRSNFTPWKCSITNSPETPSPSSDLPPESWSSTANSCASAAGEREKQFRIEVPNRIFDVFNARIVSQGMGETPHASPVVTSS